MVEHVKYSVVLREGDIEFRDYPRVAMATVSGLADDEAFGLLFDYIRGANDSSSQISMTAPVLSGSMRSEELTMTAPVVSSPGSFSFIMPAGRLSDALPAPKDQRIAIVNIDERTLAVLRFRGRTSARQLTAKQAELFGSLKRKGIQTVGSPFLMRYNPPFIPGVFRRNEVAVEVRRPKGGA